MLVVVVVADASSHHVINISFNMDDLHLMHLPLSNFGRQALASLPDDFLNPLTFHQLELVAAACIALDVVTQGKKAPRAFQLEVMLSILAGRDCAVRAATGSGKTLAMLLTQLIYPEDVVLTVSPLKLLQRAQVRNKASDMISIAQWQRRLRNSTCTEFLPLLSTRTRCLRRNCIRCVYAPLILRNKHRQTFIYTRTFVQVQ